MSGTRVAANALLATLASLTPACGVFPPAPPPPEAPWHVLFDGTSLRGFESTPFGGEGDVRVVDGAIELDFGSPLTGITWLGETPRPPYELRAVAARLAGDDFFCGLTFPAGEAHLTLVLGGWGGSVSGLSSLDGADAARNHTRTLRHFAVGVDHEVVVQVTTTGVTAWIDGDELCRADLTAQQPSVRPEVLLSRPLGVASFATRTRLRDLRWRPLP